MTHRSLLSSLRLIRSTLFSSRRRFTSTFCADLVLRRRFTSTFCTFRCLPRRRRAQSGQNVAPRAHQMALLPSQQALATSHQRWHEGSHEGSQTSPGRWPCPIDVSLCCRRRRRSEQSLQEPQVEAAELACRAYDGASTSNVPAHCGDAQVACPARNRGRAPSFHIAIDILSWPVG